MMEMEGLKCQRGRCTPNPAVNGLFHNAVVIFHLTISIDTVQIMLPGGHPYRIACDDL
jgi:hypothetical protein